MAGPYNIDNTLAVNDPGQIAWGISVANAVNDLHLRASGRVRLDAGSGWYWADVPQLQGQDWTTLSVGWAEFCPFYVGQAGFQADAVGVNVGTTDASGVIRAGIYGVDSGGNPGPLMVDAGTVSTATAGEKTLSFTAVDLPAGQYWLVQVTNSSTVTVRRTAGQSPIEMMYLASGTGASSFDPNGSGVTLISSGWTATSALPSTAILTSLTGRRSDMPFMSIRRA